MSIQVNVIPDAKRAEATVMRRSALSKYEAFIGDHHDIPLPEIGISLPLSAIYTR